MTLRSSGFNLSSFMNGAEHQDHRPGYLKSKTMRISAAFPVMNSRQYQTAFLYSFHQKKLIQPSVAKTAGRPHDRPNRLLFWINYILRFNSQNRNDQPAGTSRPEWMPVRSSLNNIDCLPLLPRERTSCFGLCVTKTLSAAGFFTVALSLL